MDRCVYGGSVNFRGIETGVGAARYSNFAIAKQWHRYSDRGGTIMGVATSEGIGVVCAENLSSWETRLGWSEAKMWH